MTMTGTQFDVVVVGGGIAGASAAYELAAESRVLLLERESQPGYHSTGRSAAMLTENYGNAHIRLLTIASREFFASPPSVFGDAKLLSPRGMLWIGRADQEEKLREELATGRKYVPSICRVDKSAALELCPSLQASYVHGAVFEPDAMDLDVHAIHQGYLRGFKQRGGVIKTDAGVQALGRNGQHWEVRTAQDQFTANTIVNAAGAWADELATMANARSIHLVPKRRTGIIFDAREDVDFKDWPCVIDVDETFYFKPESGRLMGSPADATPTLPGDAQAEELDVAQTVDRIETATSIHIRRVGRRWAGLRSFVADGSPVAGFDPVAPNFFWLAGQGGYGVMTAPALAQVACEMITKKRLPQNLADQGLSSQALAPDRL